MSDPYTRAKPLDVMVTGGTGFIGHNVVLDLLEWTDWTFTVVDAHTYAGLPEKLTNDPRFDPERVNVVTWDLTKSLVQAEGQAGPPGLKSPDIIYNIASNSHVDNSISDPVPFITDNVALMVNMLEYARIVKPKLFIQFSTDEVYGAAPDGVDFKEWSAILPSNPYSASKAAQEAIAIAYWRTYDVPLVITNTMNVLGKRQHPEKFVPKTVEYLLEGKPMTVHAEYVVTHDHRSCSLCQRGADDHDKGEWQAGSRFYTFVTNISSALKFLTERMGLLGVQQFPHADRPERFNIVGDREVKNDEMVRLVAEIIGVPAHMDYVDFHGSRPGHDRRYALDGEALERAGWRPPVSFEEGLKMTVEDSMPKVEAG